MLLRTRAVAGGTCSVQALSALPSPFGGWRGGSRSCPVSLGFRRWVLGAQLLLVLHVGCLAQECGVR